MPDSSTYSGAPRPFDDAQGRPEPAGGASLSRGEGSRGVSGDHTSGTSCLSAEVLDEQQVAAALVPARDQGVPLVRRE